MIVSWRIPKARETVAAYIAHLYMYTYIYIGIRIPTHICIHIHMSIHNHTRNTHTYPRIHSYTHTSISISTLLNLMLLSQILDAGGTDFACKRQKNHSIHQWHPEIFQSFKFFVESVAVHPRQLIPAFLFFFSSYFCSSFPFCSGRGHWT